MMKTNTRLYIRRSWPVLFLATAVICLLAACTDRSAGSAGAEAITLLGKTGRITYPAFTADVKYLNDTLLHWKTTDTTGKVTEEDAHIAYQPLNDHLYFLNWIEADGLTVSQVIDTEKGTVTAYLSYGNTQVSSGRSGELVKGKFEFIKN
ncbi:MoaF-related domain-containing protein [Chitinophaga nivalis]|uniref:MoaF-like domain-containing protein n=1 Tax=Chitinophaga nivalis TaxID=2991709 RepID=A0ABT3IGT4_9BACT|nr:hypothetical protein [Chitinophaga nivalis]MCW3467147.1 hypothetical protein [Chitinophaga nivalis]MCW3483162.1 hypothetical protein [Chitinophaga nivalis]